jgi:hypothetical protein
MRPRPAGVQPQQFGDLTCDTRGDHREPTSLADAHGAQHVDQWMSLTSHLSKRDDPVRTWIDASFPNIGALVADSRKSLRDATTTCAIDGRPPSTTGIAIDYRIRYGFAVTPPRELIAYPGAADVLSNVLMELEPDHPALWRADPDTGVGVQQPVDPFLPGLPPNAVSDFFVRLNSRVPAIAPVGRAIGEVEERELARYCLGLGLFEEVWRTGMVAPGSLLSTIGPTTTLDDFLNSVPSDWVEDLAQLAGLFIGAFVDRLREPAVLNPVFAQSAAVGGADADIIAGGTLLEIKTTINPRIDGAWIRQLLGYLLLDTDGEFAVASLGLYLARQGRLIVWPLDESLEVMAGRPIALPRLRQEFAAHLKTLMDA